VTDCLVCREVSGEHPVPEAASVARAACTLAAALRADGVERWDSVDELPDAPHGGPAEIGEEFVERLRESLMKASAGSAGARTPR